MSETVSPPRHLAELNIGRMAAPPEDPRMADFMNNLERVNAVADRSPGFVWRLKGESEATGATDLSMPGDPSMAVNLSVWETAEAFETFVWNTVHKQFYNRKAEWFEPAKTPHFVMWWIPVGHIPTLEEAQARLDDLIANGPSERAFGWEGLPTIQKWRAAQCA